MGNAIDLQKICHIKITNIHTLFIIFKKTEFQLVPLKITTFCYYFLYLTLR